MHFIGLLYFGLVLSVFTLNIPLNNGIYSPAGGYTVIISLGTPPQHFKVQVDTGSHKLVIRCQSCTQCSEHHHSHYQYAQSSTFQRVTCSDGQYFCDDCKIDPQGNSTCLLRVEYEDGGWLKGDMVSDVFSMQNLTHSFMTKFGCIEEESSDFAVDNSTDGVWGLRRSFPNKNGTFQRYDQLIGALSKQSNNQRLIGLCLAREGGMMSIGSINPSLHTQPGIIIPYDDPLGDDTVSNTLSTIFFGDILLTKNGSQSLPSLFIDSGSTNSILSFSLYQKIVAQIIKTCKDMHKKCSFFTNKKRAEDTCFNLSDNSYFKHFPPIIFTFSGVPIKWYAEEYFYPYQTINGTSYCTLFTWMNEGFVLGDDFMIGKDIVFRENVITIYPKSQCSEKKVNHAYNDSLLQKMHETVQLQPQNNITQIKGQSIRGIVSKAIIGFILVCMFVNKIGAVIGVIYCNRKCKKSHEDMVEDIVEEVGDLPMPTDQRMKDIVIQKKMIQNQ